MRLKWPPLLFCLLAWHALCARSEGLSLWESPLFAELKRLVTAGSELEIQFKRFVQDVPRLWREPQGVKHAPTEWKEDPPAHGVTGRARRQEPSGSPTICSFPFGVPGRQFYDPCGPLHRCSVAQLRCPTGEVNPNTYNGSLEDCLVQQLSCYNGSYPSLASKNCSVQQLLCNGTLYSTLPKGTTLASCTVMQLRCDNTVLDFRADNATRCANTSGLDCRDACALESRESGCVCSLDRMGEACQLWRPYTCDFKLLSPTPACRTSHLDADPVCFVYKRQDRIPFVYSLSCNFTNTTHMEASEQSTAFEYFARGEKFAISKAQADLWPFEGQLKAYNFNMLSDMSATQKVLLQPDQLLGNASIRFDLNFSLPDRFFAGNRLYFEAGLSRDSQFPGRVMRYDRRFVDVSDLHIHRSVDRSLTTTVITWIVVACVSVLLTLLLCVYWVRKRGQQRKLERRRKKLE